jgi:ATP-dependent DNA helicase RecG
VIASSNPEPQSLLETKEPDRQTLQAIDRMWGYMPFEPSPEQKRVTAEILKDLAQDEPMNRLLQGEVGSGKTAVAASAILAVLTSGRQAALMAPTEILARQHLEFFTNLGDKLGFEVNFLVGSQRLSERKIVLERISQNQPSLTIGTHSLSFPSVRFSDLALAVIDEQHRFGVKQRLALRNKRPGVNLLSLSATPIPASLSTILYGDMNISSMVGTLPGRSPSITKVFEPNDITSARALLAKLVRAGQRAFVVCPRIVKTQEKADVRGDTKGNREDSLDTEKGRFLFQDVGQNDDQYDDYDEDLSDESEESGQASESEGSRSIRRSSGRGAKSNLRTQVLVVAKELKELLPEVDIRVLHGRLTTQEKLSAIADFKSGQTRVLVSTTIVEVGVDIPEANIMMVEGAEFFGLAQLHQLRGRVGRGGGQGYFLLLPASQPNEIALARLKAIETHHNGYELAEMDLKLRGPGEELGLKQSGWPKLDYVKLPTDLALLPKAYELAKKLLDNRDLWGPELTECVKIAKNELTKDQPEDEAA